MAGADPWLSVTNATHLVLDGVPMKIAEAFRPKQRPKDVLPSGLRFDPSQSKILNVKYEFETESGFIKWLEDTERRKQEKEEQEKEEQERLEAEERQRRQEEEEKKNEEVTKIVTSRSPTDLPTNQRAQPITSSAASRETAKTVVSTMNSILLPQRVSPVTVAAVQPKSAANVDIKDFENLAEDPFDNLELETIDDMKELKSVLDNSQVPPPEEQAACVKPANSSSEEATPSVEFRDSPIYENPQDLVSDDSNIYSNVSLCQPSNSGSTNNLNRKRAPLAAPRAKINPTGNPTNNLDKSSPVSARFDAQSHTVSISAESNGLSKPNIPVQKSSKAPPARPLKPPSPVSKPSNIPEASVDSDAGAKATKIQSLANQLNRDLAAKNAPPGAVKGFSYTKVAIANGTTESDSQDRNIKDIEWPSFEPRSPQTDPKRPQLHAASQNNSLVSQSNGSSSQPINAVAGSTATTTTSGEYSLLRKKPPNAVAGKGAKSTKPRRSSRSSGDGEVVDSLLSMGFEKVQIRAAITLVGTDTKQLAEHLCAVQQLVAPDVKWQSAQQAVMICGTDLTRAGKFAKAYQQLSEFGFGDDVVKEALISSDMDMQKALDTLVQ